MVDLDKFICSMIWHSTSGGLIRQCLKDQGLEYKDGSIKPIEKEGKPVIIDAGFGSLTVHFNEKEMEAFNEGLKKKPEAEKPSTIKFNEPDIDTMVEDFWHNKDVIISSHTRGMVEEAYRQGLEDMYKRLKG